VLVDEDFIRKEDHIMTHHGNSNQYGRAIVGMLVAAGVSTVLAGIGWSITKIIDGKYANRDGDLTHGSKDDWRRKTSQEHDQDHLTHGNEDDWYEDVQDDSEYDYWVTMWNEINKRLLGDKIFPIDLTLRNGGQSRELTHHLLDTYYESGHEDNMEWLILHEDEIVRFLNDIKPDGSIAFDPEHKMVIRSNGGR
jgi:hypothetical protein